MARCFGRGARLARQVATDLVRQENGGRGRRVAMDRAALEVGFGNVDVQPFIVCRVGFGRVDQPFVSAEDDRLAFDLQSG